MNISKAALLFLFFSTVYAQQDGKKIQSSDQGNNEQVKISPEGKAYTVVKSNLTSKENLPSGYEGFPILETDDRGESKADVPKFAIERTQRTTDRVRVKFKVPRLKYDYLKSGTRFNDFVTEREIVDPVTGFKTRTRKIHDIEVAWCGADYCLNDSAYLMETCAKVGKSECDSTYETVIVDFSKLPRLSAGEVEYFYFSAFQKKIPGKAIGILLIPIEKMTKEEYVVEENKRLWRADIYTIRPLTQREIEERNKKINQVTQKQLAEVLSAKKFNETKTRYLALPTNLGKEGYTSNGESISKKNTDVEEKTITKYCFDEMGRVQSKEEVLEGTTTRTEEENYQFSNSNSSWGNSYSTEYRRIEGSPIERVSETNVISSACETRKNNLIVRESLAGMKGALRNRTASLLNDQIIKEDGN